MKDGWFLLHRKFFDHFLWKEKREYSKAEAWIDLIQMARYAQEENSRMIHGQLIKWRRGQLVASIRYLRKRWNWRSNSKVEGFLKLLEKEDMIERETKTPVGRITVCKYDFYQEPKDGVQDTNKTHKRQAKDETVKKGKEGKEGIYVRSLFSDFWDAYDIKKDRKNCENKWGKLSLEDKDSIMRFIPIYKSHEPDPKYRKNPLTFLNSEIWNDDWREYKAKTAEQNGILTPEHYL